MPTLLRIIVVAVVSLPAFWSAAAAESRAAEAGGHPLAIVNRWVTQERGHWRVDYVIRHHGASALTVAGDGITARVEGWVSNSRAPGHAVPRLSSMTVSGPTGRQAVAEVIASADEDGKCRERCVVKVWLDGSPAPADDETAAPLGIAPGASVRVQLRLEHRHVVYGEYDPLLGVRTFDLWLGSSRVHDELPLDREQYAAGPPPAVLVAPDDRKDTRVYASAPDSLHLEAHVPGNQSLRFPEVPVRHDTRMRLRFSYLIAEGGEGTCHARVTQYKDTPTAWKTLGRGQIELGLNEVGHWARVDRVLTTESDATTLALDFRIAGADVGEVWIDDVSLEPLDDRPAGP